VLALSSDVCRAQRGEEQKCSFSKVPSEEAKERANEASKNARRRFRLLLSELVRVPLLYRCVAASNTQTHAVFVFWLRGAWCPRVTDGVLLSHYRIERQLVSFGQLPTCL